MPLERTPPPSVAEASALPEDDVEFKPPSGRLAAVTRKGNELHELMNSGIDEVDFIRSNYEAYIEKIEALKVACFDQTRLNEREELKRTEWWNTNYPNIVTLIIQYEKYMYNLTGAIPKTPKSRKSSIIGSVCSSTSSARIKLLEKKAKLLATL